MCERSTEKKNIISELMLGLLIIYVSFNTGLRSSPGETWGKLSEILHIAFGDKSKHEPFVSDHLS